MTDAERIEWIEQASYEELLHKWRFEPSDSRWFQGEVGKAYGLTMRQRRIEVGNAEHVATSKRIGWGD